MARLPRARPRGPTNPLTLNALLAGCNQKSARDPVMQVSDAEAHEALEARVAGLPESMRKGGY